MPYIERIEINSLSFPLKKPFSNHVRTVYNINGIYVRIYTSDNIVGHGFIYGLSNISHTKIIPYIQNDLTTKLFDFSIDNVKSLDDYWKDYWQFYKNTSSLPEKLYALAVIDIAIWDIVTKNKNISLHQYIGGSQSKIPAYGTTGWLSFSIDELV